MKLLPTLEIPASSSYRTNGARCAERDTREIGRLSGLPCIGIRELWKQDQTEGKREPEEVIQKEIPGDRARAFGSWGVLFSGGRWKWFCWDEVLQISLSWREFSFSDVHFAFFLSFWLSSETMMTYFDELEWLIKFTVEFPLFRSVRFSAQFLRVAAVSTDYSTWYHRSIFHIFFRIPQKSGQIEGDW